MRVIPFVVLAFFSFSGIAGATCPNFNGKFRSEEGKVFEMVNRSCKRIDKISYTRNKPTSIYTHHLDGVERKEPTEEDAVLMSSHVWDGNSMLTTTKAFTGKKLFRLIKRWKFIDESGNLIDDLHIEFPGSKQPSKHVVFRSKRITEFANTVAACPDFSGRFKNQDGDVFELKKSSCELLNQIFYTEKGKSKYLYTFEIDGIERNEPTEEFILKAVTHMWEGDTLLTWIRYHLGAKSYREVTRMMYLDQNGDLISDSYLNYPERQENNKRTIHRFQRLEN